MGKPDERLRPEVPNIFIPAITLFSSGFNGVIQAGLGKLDFRNVTACLKHLSNPPRKD